MALPNLFTNEFQEPKLPLSPTEILTIVDSLQASSWDEAVVTVGDSRITLARNRKPAPATSKENSTAPVSGALANSTKQGVESRSLPTVAPATARLVGQVAPAASIGDNEHLVTAPSVGVFLLSPQPGGESYSEVGQLVKVGDVLGIVAVMKTMSSILADVNGIVTAIHVDHEGAVEFGTPLVSIKPEA